MARVKPKRRSHPDPCDHEFVTESRQVSPGRSQAHPMGASPPEYEPVGRVCKHCGLDEKEVAQNALSGRGGNNG